MNMNTSFRQPASICNASTIASRTRDSSAVTLPYSNCIVRSRRYSQVSQSSRKDVYDHHHNAVNGAITPARSVKNGWSSLRTDVTGTSIRTPVTSGKFRTSFSFRQATVPEGYPKLEFERNPRRESVVAEFSRKLAEGYDIWDDDERPVINWRYPTLPIRANRTHDLRSMANRERINKMLERENQMNKRGSRMMQNPNTQPRKDTAWWEKPKNGVRLPTTLRGPSQSNRSAWSSSMTPTRNNFHQSGSIYTPRR